QTTHNHVFFQTTQIVGFAHDGRFGQHAGGFLEGSRRDEGVGRQRGLGNTQQHVFVRSWNTVFSQDAIVLVQQFGAFNLFTRHEAGITSNHNGHAAQRLTNNHFNVLVVDLHTLRTVNVLHFVNNVVG